MSNSGGIRRESEAENATQSSATQSVRHKKDAAWEYAILLENEGKKSIRCIFCQKSFAGGGIYRFKQHLMGIKGDVGICKKVPNDVREKLIAIHAENANKKKGCDASFETVDSEEVIMQPPSKKRGVDVSFQRLFKHGVSDHSQPGIKAALQSKERWHETDLAIAMWFYDAGIPLNALNSPLFQVDVNKIATMGHGYTHPTYHALRVGLLRDAKKSVELIVENYKKSWKDTGCTIMVDGWTDNTQRSLINFCVSCPKGITFVKSVV